MNILEAIESLKQAGPLNVIWGAGCSYAGPNAATWLAFDLKVNAKLAVAGPEGLHDALLSLDRKTRREKTARFGMNWAHICLAELLRTGAVARVLTANFDDGVVNTSAALDLMPELYEEEFPELAQSATPAVYLLGDAEPATTGGLIQRGAQTGPWLVIGCSGEHFGLREALLGVPRFEHGLYWAGYFNQRMPTAFSRELFQEKRNAHFLGGFDSDSLLAYLLRGLGEFPPQFIRDGESAGAPNGKPMDQLRAWSDRVSEQAQKVRERAPVAARELLQKAEKAADAEYETLVAQAVRQYELHFRCLPGSGYAGALFLGLLAEKRSPRRAAALREKGLEWIRRYPAGKGMEAMEARQVAESYAHLARFRTGSEADALYTRAEQALPAEVSGRFGAFVLDQCADLLCQWADQERNERSADIFERARRKYTDTQRLHPDKRERLFRFAQALRQRAMAISGEDALELLAQARGAAGELVGEDGADLAAWQLLGLIVVAEAEKSPGPQTARLQEAAVFFRKAISLREEAAASILQNWAAALGAMAMSRNGAEALELYAAASEKFGESEALKADSRALRKNWSSALLREARERGGSGEVFERAREQAEKANAIDAGSGAYNLACIAAELGQQDDVAKYLLQSAEFGQIMPLSHTLRDVNFEKYRAELWFRKLLDEIYG